MLINLPVSNVSQGTIEGHPEEIQGMGEALLNSSGETSDQSFSFENALSEMELGNVEVIENASEVLPKGVDQPSEGVLGQEEVLLESEIGVITGGRPSAENLTKHPKAIPLEQLKPQTPTEIIPQNISGGTEGTQQISGLNLKSILQSTLSKEDGLDEAALENDPRLQLTDSAKIRQSISIEEQIDQARDQLKNSKDRSALQKAEVATSAAILHQIRLQDEKAEGRSSELEKRLNPQFRVMSELDPQLQKFNPNFKFDPVIQSTHDSQSQNIKQLGSNSPIDRNLSNLNKLFTSTQQEEATMDSSFSDNEIGSSFDNVFTDSLEESYSLKETRSTIGTSRSSVTSSSLDLDQIMSKVNLKEDGAREIIMQLHPQHLGELKMKIIQEGNNLAVEMLVGSLEAKQLIDANLNELRSHFLEQEEKSFNQLQFAVDVEQHQDPHSESTLEHGSYSDDYTAEKQKVESRSQDIQSQISKQVEGHSYRQSDVNSGLNVYV